MHSLPVKINKSGLGSNLDRCMWVEFVFGSCLDPRVFLQVLWFSFLFRIQTNTLKLFHFDEDRVPQPKVDLVQVLLEDLHKIPAKAELTSSINIYNLFYLQCLCSEFSAAMYMYMYIAYCVTTCIIEFHFVE